MAPSFRSNVRRYVLDANALIGFFEGRLGVSGKVQRLLSEALQQDAPLLMSAVSWGEVFYLEWRYHGEAKAREAEARVRDMPIAVIGVDQERASRAGAVKQRHGLGYADAFAAELAMEQDAWLVTADAEFSESREGSVDLRAAPAREIDWRISVREEIQVSDLVSNPLLRGVMLSLRSIWREAHLPPAPVSGGARRILRDRSLSG